MPKRKDKKAKRLKRHDRVAHASSSRPDDGQHSRSWIFLATLILIAICLTINYRAHQEKVSRISSAEDSRENHEAGMQWSENSEPAKKAPSTGQPAAKSGYPTRLRQESTGNADAVRSQVRVRDGVSYEGGGLDFEGVAVFEGAVHIYGADDESISAVQASGLRLSPESLRARHFRDILIRVHEGPMPARFCDQRAHGNASLFFIKPWFWQNLYHLFNDAAMLIHHVAATPNRRPGSHKLMIFGEHTLGAGPGSYYLPWALLLFGQTGGVFDGLGSAHALFTSKRPQCVGALHWGQPQRVLSADRIDPRERALALANLKKVVEHACPDAQLPGRSNSLSDFFQLKGLRSRVAREGAPRAVFVVRPPPIGKEQKNAGNRFYHNRGLRELSEAFANRGVEMRECCNFEVDMPCDMAKEFFAADIVIGLHGAGLANLALARQGAVLVELKSHFMRASDVFQKIALGKGGGYLWVNTARAGSNGSLANTSGHGQTLPLSKTRQVVDCALALWAGGRREGSFEMAPCACSPVGGGETTATALPGLFAFAPVGHRGRLVTRISRRSLDSDGKEVCWPETEDHEGALGPKPGSGLGPRAELNHEVEPMQGAGPSVETTPSVVTRAPPSRSKAQRKRNRDSRARTPNRPQGGVLKPQAVPRALAKTFFDSPEKMAEKMSRRARMRTGETPV